MILMIDNYDSFTYNLVQYFGELGADIKVVRNDEITIEEIAALAPEKIVISPGPCTPTEAGVSVDTIKTFAGKIPLLGVCLGHQSIGQAIIGRCPNIHHLVETLFISNETALIALINFIYLLLRLLDQFQLVLGNHHIAKVE